MLYKFIGGKDERALLCAFDNIFGRGSMKFSNAHTFNDPFEFKYGSVFPQTRAQVEAWHKAYSRFNVSDGDINELWRNLESGGRDYIFGVEIAEFAEAVLFLLSDAAGYITSEVIRVRGGR